MYVNGRFCGLVAVAVTVAESPGLIVVGLTEHEIVGGSNSFTVNVAVDGVANCHGFNPSLPGLPSLASHFTVC